MKLYESGFIAGKKKQKKKHLSKVKKALARKLKTLATIKGVTFTNIL